MSTSREPRVRAGRAGVGRRGVRRALSGVGLALGLVAAVATPTGGTGLDVVGSARTLDGSNNNRLAPTWGQAGQPYRRSAATRYADGLGQPVAGPEPRYVSNRIFNDSGQNLFSENGLTQWNSVWGQFVDHTIGLRATAGGERAPITFDAADPLEAFRNDLGAISFTRTPAAPGTGTTRPRQQLNSIDSFVDASAVYGNDPARLEWLREGPVDGDLTNNSALLLLPDDQLPVAGARNDPATAPATDRDGRLRAAPDDAVVAGDVRANENVALTGVQLLFAREHNRIVRSLPAPLSEEEKFQVARRIVGAEQQYITYHEFLPAHGLRLDRYRGYRPTVDPTLTNEFATVGYRGHSTVHGVYVPVGDAATWTPAELDAFRAQGITVIEGAGGRLSLAVPLNVAFFNPALLPQVGLGPLLAGLAGIPDYRNDEQIDNQLRSVLFQVPKPGIADPSVCLDGPALPDCFQGVQDLGALDVARGRDHGMPDYNTLRQAYGLRPKPSFTAITGEATAAFPADPDIDPANPLDDPDILDFVELRDAQGNVVEAGTPAGMFTAVSGVRRTTLAARLAAVYGDVVGLDAFVGMQSEPHLPGSEFGELQYRIWKDQFERLRDGDRYFYANDPVLALLRVRYGLDYRRTLAQVIVDNTELAPGDLPADVFRLS
jgi:hypothetical protein